MDSMKADGIQQKMFEAMQDKRAFDKAQTYAYEYLDHVFDRHVYPKNEALDVLNAFEEPLPEESSETVAVIDFLHQNGAPATVAQLGGRYFGFVNGSAVPAGLAAKNLATYWDQNTAMQVISPLASKLEVVVENWLRELLGVPDRTVAGFVSGTSTANFCGLAAARYRLIQRQGWDINEKGLFEAPLIRIVAGKQAHSTVLKAVSLLGFGKDNIEWVDVDEQGRVIPENVPELDGKTILIAQAGNVNSGAFDPLEDICKQANEAEAWVHIDGAFGLWTRASEQLRHLTNGMEGANSWALDGHKTLNTPYDSGIVLCEDKEALVSALHMSGSYIVVGDERDGMFYTPEMSRRARIIELWATMKYLGKKGMDEMILGLHERACQFADGLKNTAGFEVVNDIAFNQILVRCETDELTEKTLKSIQESRICWVGGSFWEERKVIRISVCSWATTTEDVDRSVTSFEKALKSNQAHSSSKH